MTTQGIQPYDLIAEFYDEDMGVTNPGLDIAFYRALARRTHEPVLELGCGTGRITLPLLQDGHRVDALDSSSAMLRRLEAKAADAHSDRLRIHQCDMARFDFPRKYGCVLCPFSAFYYVVDDRERHALLDRVLRSLSPGGLFALDGFVPKAEVLRRPDEHVYNDYCRRRADGTTLERRRTIAKNLETQTDRVTRIYRVRGPDGSALRTVEVTTIVRYFYHEELQRLLADRGYEIIETGSDFVSPYREGGTTVYFVSRPAVTA